MHTRKARNSRKTETRKSLLRRKKCARYPAPMKHTKRTQHKINTFRTRTYAMEDRSYDDAARVR